MTCRVLSLREKEDHPVLISTSRHMSSGILEVTKEAWANGGLFGTSEVLGGDAYELRIVGLRDGGKQWVPARIAVSDEDKAAGVTVPQSVEAGLLRVKIVSPKTRTVQWRMDFTHIEILPGKAQNLKAAAPSAYEPVVLTWESSAAFHTITRDGQVIAAKHFGTTFTDAGAKPGKSHTYTVAIDGQSALPAITVVMPGYPPGPPFRM